MFLQFISLGLGLSAASRTSSGSSNTVTHDGRSLLRVSPQQCQLNPAFQPSLPRQQMCKKSHLGPLQPHSHHTSSAAAAAAKSLQSCPTLCDPIDGSPPDSAVPGILQARPLEWVAISFSNAWKWKVKVESLSRVRLLATPWTAAYQAPLSMQFSRQEYWSGVPLPSPIPPLVITKLPLQITEKMEESPCHTLLEFLTHIWEILCFKLVHLG